MSRNYDDFGAEAERWSGEKTQRVYEPVEKSARRAFQNLYDGMQARKNAAADKGAADPRAAPPAGMSNPIAEYQAKYGNSKPLGEIYKTLESERNPYDAPQHETEHVVTDPYKRLGQDKDNPQLKALADRMYGRMYDNDRSDGQYNSFAGKKKPAENETDSTTKSLDFEAELEYAANGNYQPKHADEFSPIAKSADSGMPKYMDFYAKLASVTKSIGQSDIEDEYSEDGDIGEDFDVSQIPFNPGDEETPASMGPVSQAVLDNPLLLHMTSMLHNAYSEHNKATGQNYLPMDIYYKIIDDVLKNGTSQFGYNTKSDHSGEDDNKDDYDIYNDDDIWKEARRSRGAPKPTPKFIDDDEDPVDKQERAAHDMLMAATDKPIDPTNWDSYRDFAMAHQAKLNAEAMRKQRDREQNPTKALYEEGEAIKNNLDRKRSEEEEWSNDEYLRRMYDLHKDDRAWANMNPELAKILEDMHERDMHEREVNDGKLFPPSMRTDSEPYYNRYRAAMNRMYR